jgi:hypothetical protein
LEEQQENDYFYLQLLTIEGKHETIRALAKTKAPDELLDYLFPIKESHSDFCFEKIKEALSTMLAKASQRKTYRLAATLLQFARGIHGYREKANELQKQYEGLDWPALTDELNKPW